MQDDLQSALNKMKVKLEKETVGHLESNQKIAELEYRINELNLLVCYFFSLSTSFILALFKILQITLNS